MIDQLNSISCNADDFTCGDGTVFSDGCTNYPIMKCNSDGSYEAIFTDTAVDPYSPLYQVRDKNNNVELGSFGFYHLKELLDIGL